MSLAFIELFGVPAGPSEDDIARVARDLIARGPGAQASASTASVARAVQAHIETLGRRASSFRAPGTGYVVELR